MLATLPCGVGVSTAARFRAPARAVVPGASRPLHRPFGRREARRGCARSALPPVAREEFADEKAPSFDAPTRAAIRAKSAAAALLGRVSAALKAARVPAACLALALCVAALSAAPAHAARSSGRVGGSSFSSSSRSFGGGSSSFGGASTSAFGRSSFPTHTHSSSTLILPLGGAAVAPLGFIGGGFSFGSVVFFAVLAVFAINVFTDLAKGTNAGALEGDTDRVAVCRLQVGLLGLARELQGDLDRIADKADTSTRQGLHFVLQETCMSLLRHPEYIVLGQAGSKGLRTPEDAEAKFNELSVEERSKVANETLVNVNSRKRKEAVAVASPEGGSNELIVVTLLVAATGSFSMPKVSNLAELQGALRILAGLPTSAIQAVEILWTPQQQGDVLTRDEVSQLFPKLNSL